MVGSFLLPKGKIFILLTPNLLAKPVVEAVSSSIGVGAGDVWLSLILAILGGNGFAAGTAHLWRRVAAHAVQRRSCGCGLAAEARARL